MSNLSELAAGHVQKRLDAFRADVAFAAETDLPSKAAALVQTLDIGTVGSAVATLLLIDTAGHLVDDWHNGDTPTPCACYRRACDELSSFAFWAGRDPRTAFVEWSRRFSSRFLAEHPPTAASQAAALIRSMPAGSWRLRDLAQATGTHPVRLRIDFERRYQMTPLAYLQLARAARALDACATAVKVEAVAWDVGYRSKKDLYAALKRWVGATPTEVRRLSEPERQWLNEQLRSWLLRGAPVDHRRRRRRLRRDR